MHPAFVTLLALLLIVGLLAAASLRRLLTLRRRMRASFRELAEILERRHDLLHQLGEHLRAHTPDGWKVAEGMLPVLNDSADALRRARRQPGNAPILQGLRFCESRLAMAERRVVAAAESCVALRQHPKTIKALEDLRAKAAPLDAARRSYNEAAIALNQARNDGPLSAAALLMGFKPADLFVVGKPTERELPTGSVDLGGH